MFQQGVHIIPTCSEIILGEAKKEKPNMDWNANIFRTVAPFDYQTAETQTQTQTTCSFTGFLCNPNYHPFPGNQSLEARHDTSLEMVFPAPKTLLDRRMMTMSSYASQEKKRRLTVDQLESLESSFQEEIKLDSDRKMKLARELGLQPRQVAVWFQNRRARWRAKKLEHLYGVLKHEYDAVTREKQKLHEEVQRLKYMLTRRQLCSSYNTEPSCEESVESIHSYNVNQVQAQGISNSTLEGSSGTGGGGAGLFNVHHDYDLVSPTYWGAFPSSYPSES